MKKRLRGSSERKRTEYGGSGDGAGEDVLYVPLLNGALVKMKSKWLAELEARKRGGMPVIGKEAAIEVARAVKDFNEQESPYASWERKKSVALARETDRKLRECKWNRQTGNYGYRDSCGLSRRLDLLRLLVGQRDG